MYFVAIYPTLSRFYVTSRDSMRRLLSATVKLAIIVSLPMAVGGTILARPIMNLLYGSQYDNGIIAFQILIWVTAIMLVSSSYSSALLASGQQSKYAKVVAFGLGINLILNLTLIPSFGLMGTAIAALVTQTLVTCQIYRYFNQVMPVPFKGYLLRPALSCIGMGIFLYLCSNWNVVLLVVFGAVVYLFLLIAMGGVTRREINLIRDRFFPSKRI
jgi:O-antigen/teichoic acid export membrane protein